MSDTATRAAEILKGIGEQPKPTKLVTVNACELRDIIKKAYPAGAPSGPTSGK